MSQLPKFSSRRDLEETSRKAAANAYLGNQRSLCRVLSGYKFFVPTDDRSVAPHLIMEGFWEAWVSLAVLRQCRARKGATAVNVGANIGYYSVLLADCVGPDGCFVGFEPQAELAELAASNLQINGMGWGRILNQAAGDGTVSEVYLNTFEHLKGSAFVSIEHNEASRRVECATVDSAVDRCDILFIDAEGYEPQILRGAARALAASKDPIVFLEFSPASYPSPQAFFEEMAAEYVVHRVDFDGETTAVDFADMDGTEWSTLMLTRR
jgi:FkbM family methyltransferase